MLEVNNTIDSVPGFRVGSVDAGLRKQPAPDLALVVADQPGTAAGVFTTNRVKAAPVLISEARVQADPNHIRAVLINAACANACTGDQGLRNAEQTAAWVANAIGCKPESVLLMSTGVIGTQLPMDKMQQGISAASAALKPNGWHDASTAIMTTDTKPKRASVTTQDFTVAGIAKGAGMIAPNMATMLSVITTDVRVPADVLQQSLHKAVDLSFNRIVIDGDMSTNDTVLLLASGASGVEIRGSLMQSFDEALTAVCKALAQGIVRDGEGVTRFITLNVVGAQTPQEAHQIGNTIATSPLVKTAFYGGDANWGRILAAAGRAGVELDQTKLSLWYDELQLVANGTPLTYDEDRANARAGQPEVTVKLDLGRGSAEATIWTCDLSHDYVSINGHYRT
ncbi:MAG: bifunctional glutamate N-acetyltransferase/amino-acid acetyltransferase ArgJ [Anaerolineae bacterium]|nr:bifunctional glutamate N-acetyltransferase/amino-acid acetyltransferase ArgJ [Anaerolineae bacterium]